MPRYKLTITRTETTVSTATEHVDLPTDDVEFVRRYAEMMMHEDMRYVPGGIRPVYRGRAETRESFRIEASPEREKEPEFAEVYAQPPDTVMPADDDDAKPTFFDKE